MPGKHKLLDDYPIIVSIFSGIIKTKDVVHNCQIVDNYLAEKNLSKVYWIMDAVNIDFSRETAIQIAEISSQELPGSVGDLRVVPLVIMSPKSYAYMQEELENRHFTLHHPRFPTMYDALSFALFLAQSDSTKMTV